MNAECQLHGTVFPRLLLVICEPIRLVNVYIVKCLLAHESKRWCFRARLLQHRLDHILICRQFLRLFPHHATMKVLDCQVKTYLYHLLLLLISGLLRDDNFEQGLECNCCLCAWNIWGVAISSHRKQLLEKLVHCRTIRWLCQMFRFIIQFRI